MLRVLLVDDEAISRRRLRRLLADESDVVVVAECGDGRHAVTAARAHALDLVLLDVDLPGQDGLATAAQVTDLEGLQVVIVTGHPAFAARAFAVRAVDYLVKPVTRERLAATLVRVRALQALRASADDGRRLRRHLAALVAPADPPADDAPAPAGAPGAGYLRRLRVRQEDRVLLVQVDDVDWFEAQANYVHVHVGPERYVMRANLGALVPRLDPARFARIHRSRIVNLDRLRELQPDAGGELAVVLRDGRRLRLSRSYRASLRGR
jgi:two-component system LytT family response regulator